MLKSGELLFVDWADLCCSMLCSVCLAGCSCSSNDFETHQHAACCWLYSFSIPLGKVGTLLAWMGTEALQPTVTDMDAISPHITSLSLLGFSAIVNSGIW